MWHALFVFGGAARAPSGYDSRVRWRFGPWSLAAIVPLLTARSASGATASFRNPSAGDRLPSGSTVFVAWTLESSTLEARDEMELVLSLDDGASFPIRVTGRMGTAARSVTWRVPAVRSRHARIALRAGEEERTASEALLLVSDSFAIEGPNSSGPEEFYPVGEGIRTREALEGAPVRESGGAIGSGRTENLRCAGLEAVSLEERPPVAAASPRPATCPQSEGCPVRREPKGPARLLRAEIPLRL